MKLRWGLCLAVFIPCLGLSSITFAQLTAADFDRALDLQKKYDSLVLDQPDAPVWQDRSDSFIYRRSVEGGHEFILVDAATHTKQPAFDHAKLAAALSSAAQADYKPTTLPFQEFHFVDDRAALEFRVERTRWRWWNEQWMGWPIGPWYSASSNVDNAWRLQGKLMLVVGEMDHNVDPSSTYQVVDRLIKAGKTFNLLVVPGADHGTRGPWARYTARNLLDYYVRNLLNEQLPDWNAEANHGPFPAD